MSRSTIEFSPCHSHTTAIRQIDLFVYQTFGRMCKTSPSNTICKCLKQQMRQRTSCRFVKGTYFRGIFSFFFLFLLGGKRRKPESACMHFLCSYWRLPPLLVRKAAPPGRWGGGKTWGGLGEGGYWWSEKSGSLKRTGSLVWLRQSAGDSYLRRLSVVYNILFPLM